MDPGQPSGGKHEFILFVSGMSIKSLAAIENFNAIYNEYLKDHANFQIIDIGNEKAMAVQFGIVAIPTLIRIEPHPIRTLVGDLSNKEKVLNYLGIT
nr:circadian clock KaiB family protein [Flavobacterium sp.]